MSRCILYSRCASFPNSLSRWQTISPFFFEHSKQRRINRLVNVELNIVRSQSLLMGTANKCLCTFFHNSLKLSDILPMHFLTSPIISNELLSIDLIYFGFSASSSCTMCFLSLFSLLFFMYQPILMFSALTQSLQLTRPHLPLFLGT